MTIPIFSFVWVSALKEHWLHGGDDSLLRKFDSQIEFMICKALEFFDPVSGLYSLSPNKELWHFYEWVPGLSTVGDKEQSKLHAPYNLYFYEMLCSYAEILEHFGENEKASRYLSIAAALKNAINTAFWDNGHNCYATRLVNGMPDGFHEHIQFLAIYNEIVPAEKMQSLLERIYSGRLVRATFSVLPYVLRGMMAQAPDTRKYISEKVLSAFNPMVFSGCSSLWETPEGAADFEGAGSLCHAWSSLPVYYDHACVLGVQPLEPGFLKFQISPYSDRFYRAKGSVTTPHGLINVEWERCSGGLKLRTEAPSGLVPVVSSLPECPVISASHKEY